MAMRDKSSALRRLERVYGEITSVEGVLRGVAKAGITGKIAATDLYTRSLDLQNLGGFPMLEHIGSLVAQRVSLDGASRVLDVGCGMGGPGRYLADHFGSIVIGIDLLPERIKAAATLTETVGLANRVTYRQADATDLPFSDAAFDQAWMLDVSIHIADKVPLFRELARVLKPHGLLVMHEQMGPLPPAMRPVARRSPYIAPSLIQTLRYMGRAGFRLLVWHDTTRTVLNWFETRRAGLVRRRDETEDRYRRRLVPFTAYAQALGEQGSQTGIVIAERAA